MPTLIVMYAIPTFGQNYFGNDCKDSKINWVLDYQIGKCPYIHPTIDNSKIAKVEFGNIIDQSSSDYHCYYTETQICNIDDCTECTEKKVFEFMLSRKSFIAPTLDESPVINCGVKTLEPSSPIITTIHQNNFSIINYTSKIYLKDGSTVTHIFHPGKVQRTVFKRGNSIFIGTIGDGVGTGFWKYINVLVGKNGLWNAIDYDIKLNFKCNKNSKNTTLFLFDVSGSMNEASQSGKSKIVEARSAAITTLNTLSNSNSSSAVQPYVSVRTFSGGCVTDPTTVNLDFTSDMNAAATAIQNIPQPNGATPLPQATQISEAHLRQYLIVNSLKQGKLIVMSDGESTCGAIRPADVYAYGQNGQVTIPVQGTIANPLVRYYTVGFNIAPGSNAERDLQYLAQKSGGKYLSAQDGFELTKAFQKFNRVFIPKEAPSIDTISTSAKTLFSKGLSSINDEEFEKALENYKQFTKSTPKDCNGFYNLALMHEANEYFKAAIKNYETYLQLCPNPQDKDYVRKQIESLNIEHDKYVEYNKKIVMSDLDYLNLHFKKIQNGESVALAVEFIGFISEKWIYYRNLAEIIESDDRLFKTNANEVFKGLKECVETIKRNPQAWDRDATPVLSRTYLNMERLIKTF